MRSPRRQDHSVGMQHLAAGKTNGVEFQSGFDGHRLLPNHLKTVPFGVLQEFVAQLKTAYFDESRVVFHTLGDGHLSTGNPLFYAHSLECGPHRIHARRETARAATHDDEIMQFRHL